MKILICIDQSPAAQAAASLVQHLCFPLDISIVLLGVLEAGLKRDALSKVMKQIQENYFTGYLDIQRKFSKGEASDQIMREADKGAYELIAVGFESHHRIFPPRKIGNTTSKLSAHLQTPLLIARNVPPKIKRILICTSAEPYSTATIVHGSKILSFCQAPISVLHVMSQISLGNFSTMEDLQDTAESAIKRQTREGKYLMNAMQEIRSAGIRSEIQPRLRHGLVLEEVVAEIKESGVDILVIGSHHQPGQSWLVEHLLENVTKDLIQEAPCSVLVV
jgi:nucleotide-binding universal stress UspA family protein